MKEGIVYAFKSIGAAAYLYWRGFDFRNPVLFIDQKESINGAFIPVRILGVLHIYVFKIRFLFRYGFKYEGLYVHCSKYSSNYIVGNLLYLPMEYEKNQGELNVQV